jgi:hypothetical protein
MKKKEVQSFYRNRDLYPTYDLIRKIVDKVPLVTFGKKSGYNFNSVFAQDLQFLIATVYIVNRFRAMCYARISTDQLIQLLQDIYSNEEFYSQLKIYSRKSGGVNKYFKAAIEILQVTDEEISMLMDLLNEPEKKVKVYRNIIRADHTA